MAVPDCSIASGIPPIQGLEEANFSTRISQEEFDCNDHGYRVAIRSDDDISVTEFATAVEFPEPTTSDG